MQRNKLMGVVALLLCIGMMIPSVSAQAATTIYNEKTGVEDGYDYALWKDYGDTSMTLNGGGNFSCWWDNIGNALFRKGKTFDCTKTYSQIGNISIDYGCYYQPEGNSYLCVYGWSRNPLVEYYIVDSWGTWRLELLPKDRLRSMAEHMMYMKQLVTISRQLTVTQHSNSTGVYVQANVQAEPFR